MTGYRITTDRKGRLIAHRFSRSQMRYFRCGVEEAQIAIATGAGYVSEWPTHAEDRAAAEAMWREMEARRVSVRIAQPAEA